MFENILKRCAQTAISYMQYTNAFLSTATAYVGLNYIAEQLTIGIQAQQQAQNYPNNPDAINSIKESETFMMIAVTSFAAVLGIVNGVIYVSAQRYKKKMNDAEPIAPTSCLTTIKNLFGPVPPAQVSIAIASGVGLGLARELSWPGIIGPPLEAMNETVHFHHPFLWCAVSAGLSVASALGSLAIATMTDKGVSIVVVAAREDIENGNLEATKALIKNAVSTATNCTFFKCTKWNKRDEGINAISDNSGPVAGIRIVFQEEEEERRLLLSPVAK